MGVVTRVGVQNEQQKTTINGKTINEISVFSLQIRSSLIYVKCQNGNNKFFHFRKNPPKIVAFLCSDFPFFLQLFIFFIHFDHVWNVSIHQILPHFPQDNYNVLHIASMFSREDVVKTLLSKKGVDAFSTGGVSRLLSFFHEGVQNFQLAKSFQQHILKVCVVGERKSCKLLLNYFCGLGEFLLHSLI